MKKYLITCAHDRNAPINHGLVEIDENNYVNGETPVEDFGMFYYRDEPFPEDKDAIMKFFFDFMAEGEYGMDSVMDGQTVRYWLKHDKQMLKRRYFYCAADFSSEVMSQLF